MKINRSELCLLEIQHRRIYNIQEYNSTWKLFIRTTL